MCRYPTKHPVWQNPSETISNLMFDQLLEATDDYLPKLIVGNKKASSTASSMSIKLFVRCKVKWYSINSPFLSSGGGGWGESQLSVAHVCLVSLCNTLEVEQMPNFWGLAIPTASDVRLVTKDLCFNFLMGEGGSEDMCVCCVCLRIFMSGLFVLMFM